MISLILIFLKIGFLGIGGGYAMLSLILKDSLTLGITIQQFADLNTLDLLAPGPIAVNSATYVGFITFGFLGGFLATLAVCCSAFVYSTLFLKYEAFISNNQYLNKILNYLEIAALSMIASVAITLLFNSIFHNDLPLVSILSILFTSLLRFHYKIEVIPSLLFVAFFGSFLYLFSI